MPFEGCPAKMALLFHSAPSASTVSCGTGHTPFEGVQRKWLCFFIQPPRPRLPLVGRVIAFRGLSRTTQPTPCRSRVSSENGFAFSFGPLGLDCLLWDRSSRFVACSGRRSRRMTFEGVQRKWLCFFLQPRRKWLCFFNQHRRLTLAHLGQDIAGSPALPPGHGNAKRVHAEYFSEAC
jgi:hypothetical protein